MDQRTYSVDLTDIERLRKMTDEFLGRGLCLVKSQNAPPEGEIVRVSLALPEEVRIPIQGRVARRIGDKGFVIQLEADAATKLSDDLRGLLSATAPSPEVDPLGGTMVHPTASSTVPESPNALPTSPPDMPESPLAMHDSPPAKDDSPPAKGDSPPTMGEEAVLAKTQAPAQPSLVGQILDDKYQINRLLGRGGMGQVYDATHRYLETRVALKVLLPELAKDSNFVTRFLREARSVATLQNPHTVTVHDFGVTDEGVLYFTMDLLEGVPLTDIIKKRAPLPFPRAAHILLQACASLQEAHENGLLHRDLKPDNLFVTPQAGGLDHVTILDFGIAQLIGGSERLTVTGTICGTPHYLSPEQAQGGDLDARSDLYSLGVIFYEMLSGVCPFEAENTVAVLMKQIQEVPPALSLAYPDLGVHPQADDLLSELLSKDSSGRPYSAEALAGRVRGIAAQIGVRIPGEAGPGWRQQAPAISTGPKKSPAPAPRKPVQATPKAASAPPADTSRSGLPSWFGYALSGVAVFVILLLFWRPWTGDEPTESTPTAQQVATNRAQEMEPEPEYLDPSVPEFPSVAPSPWPNEPDSEEEPEEDEEPWEEEEDEPVLENEEPATPTYIRLSQRKLFCRHLVALTAQEWAVEDPAYNSIIEGLEAGPSTYPRPLRAIYDDCLGGFGKRAISESEVRCVMRSGSLGELEACGR